MHILGASMEQASFRPVSLDRQRTYRAPGCVYFKFQDCIRVRGGDAKELKKHFGCFCMRISAHDMSCKALVLSDQNAAALIFGRMLKVCSSQRGTMHMMFASLR